MNNIMIDLETLSTDPNAAIIQIGACYFEPFTGQIGNTFEVCLIPDPEAHVSYSTIAWWFKQAEQARSNVMNNPIEAREAILKYTEFAKQAKCVWSKGYFDFMILQSNFNRLRIEFPHKYWDCRDMRSVTELCRMMMDLKNGKSGKSNTHTALDDCKNQVSILSDFLSRVKNNMK